MRLRDYFILRDLDPDHEWEQRAACGDTLDLLEVFTMPGVHAREAEALAVCARCPVRPQCEGAAAERDQIFGIAAGRRIG